MKFFSALLTLASAVSAAHLPIYGNPNKKVHKPQQLADIKADSKLGHKLLANARKLEQNNDEEVDFTWVADYSIKFQGCHHVSQWNEEADGEEDVRIQTKRLIRFRLCPTNTCTASSASGCDSGYGDYIIDMTLYLQAYYEAVEQLNEYKCQYLEEYTCAACDGNDDQDICLWECFKENGGMEEICMDENPYNDDNQQQERFELAQFVECAGAEFPDNNNGRRLNQDVEYFMGPYCAEQGGAIYLGLFTDETCTTFADDDGGSTTYEKYAYGNPLPYADNSIVGMECVSCKEPEEDNNNGNDNQDADNVIEMCEEIYRTAGKCETYLGIDDANENACNYMEGIKIVRQNGTVESKATGGNKTASIFIGVFVVAFVLLAAYVYYLNTKLARASINLSE